MTPTITSTGCVTTSKAAIFGPLVRTLSLIKAAAHSRIQAKSTYRTCRNKRPGRSIFRINQKNSETHQTPIGFVYSPLWKITHQKPSVLCTPPFEKSPIKSHRFCVLPPLKIHCFWWALILGGRLFRQIRYFMSNNIFMWIVSNVTDKNAPNCLATWTFIEKSFLLTFQTVLAMINQFLCKKIIIGGEKRYE